MRTIFCLLLIFFSFQLTQARAENPEGKKYFDMPVKEWLGLSENEKIKGTEILLPLMNKNSTQEQIKSVTACMNTTGQLPNWLSMDVGALLTKCAFETKVLKGPDLK